MTSNNKDKVKRIQDLRRSNAASYTDPRPKKERTRSQIKNAAIKKSKNGD